MKLIISITIFCCFINYSEAQKVSFRWNWNTVQIVNWENQETLRLDTNFYDGLHYYIEDLEPSFGSELGFSAEYRAKNNFFTNTGINLAFGGLEDKSNSNDSLKSDVTFNFSLYSIYNEVGYYFNKSSPVKPYISLGISISKLKSNLEEYDTEYSVYNNYFNSSPAFLSGVFKSGLKLGPLGIGMCYSFSFTPTSLDKKMKAFKNFTFFSFSADLVRSSRLKKSQYKSKFESDDINIKRSQVLKQSEKSWSLGMPYYRFVNNPFLKAYSFGIINYRINPNEVPVSAWVPNINLNTINTLNSKRTFYFQTNLGYSNIRLKYKNAMSTSISNTSSNLNPEVEFINPTYEDILLVYHNVWLGIGNGYKIKTTGRSFIYFDADIRFNFFGRNDESKFELPVVKRFVFTSSVEAGIKFNHSGIALSLERNISKMDKYQFYQHMYQLNLKFIYDISSR